MIPIISAIPDAVDEFPQSKTSMEGGGRSWSRQELRVNRVVVLFVLGYQVNGSNRIILMTPDSLMSDRIVYKHTRR